MDFHQQRKQMVEYLKREGRIYSKKVEGAFLNIPREYFIPEELKTEAYIDTPLSIGYGQTISAPHMVAIMVEALDLKPGQRVLEIGSGSGYHAAIVAYLVAPNGHVFSVERLSELAEFAKRNLEKAGIDNVTVETGDGSQGLEKYAPYDRIYVTCAAPDIPIPLIEQLKDPGKLLIPVGRIYSDLYLVEKKKNKIYKKNLGGCAFVPMIGKHGY
ncbi:MAG: protein-L-isoaspartate O-methyltransferase [Thermoplasmata archaeon]|nr:MAG: protein-L-isoaspartate O-methyltransferase [Thermoplasmata archaeon]